MDENTLGLVYLIHFDRPHHHARHYLGWTVDLAARLKLHRSGKGSRLLAAIAAAGIGFEVVRTWDSVPLSKEKELKKGHNGRKLCPVCHPAPQGESKEEINEQQS